MALPGLATGLWAVEPHQVEAIAEGDAVALAA